MLFSPGSDTGAEVVDDKIVHGVLFAALALTSRLAAVGVVPLVIGLAAYAGASEVLQGVLPIDRDADPFDALADLVGVAVGVLAAFVVPLGSKA